MPSELIPVLPGHLSQVELGGVPAIIGQAGEEARWRFREFLTENIRNKNTRLMYLRALPRP